MFPSIGGNFSSMLFRFVHERRTIRYLLHELSISFDDIADDKFSQHLQSTEIIYPPSPQCNLSFARLIRTDVVKDIVVRAEWSRMLANRQGNAACNVRSLVVDQRDGRLRLINYCGFSTPRVTEGPSAELLPWSTTWRVVSWQAACCVSGDPSDQYLCERNTRNRSSYQRERRASPPAPLSLRPRGHAAFSFFPV